MGAWVDGLCEQVGGCMLACLLACLRACVPACVRACVRACMFGCAHFALQESLLISSTTKDVRLYEIKLS